MTIHDEAKVEILKDETLSKNWYHLRNVTFNYTGSTGATVKLKREVYDRGNGATILLQDRARDTVVLVRQFRMPAHLNGHSGWLLETPAGLLDGDQPEEAIRREAMEETGYRVGTVRPLFRSFMSPGAVTEIIHFFAADIDSSDRIEAGGGVAHEHEDIEVVELPLDAALAMIKTGEIVDAKTIMLLQWAEIERLKSR
nr:NUDIX domain-containing protein [uncultured Gellertiella sp.]